MVDKTVNHKYGRKYFVDNDFSVTDEKISVERNLPPFTFSNPLPLLVISTPELAKKKKMSTPIEPHDTQGAQTSPPDPPPGGNLPLLFDSDLSSLRQTRKALNPTIIYIMGQELRN